MSSFAQPLTPQAEASGDLVNVSERNKQLEAEMSRLGDVFSTVDPKDAKRAKKGKPEQAKRDDSTDKPEPDEATKPTEMTDK